MGGGGSQRGRGCHSGDPRWGFRRDANCSCLRSRDRAKYVVMHIDASLEGEDYIRAIAIRDEIKAKVEALLSRMQIGLMPLEQSA